MVRNRLVFALPKGRKTRDVPLPDSVATDLAAHLAAFPPAAVTLPWEQPGGELVTVRLVFSTEQHTPVRRSHFGEHIWRSALVAAGIEPSRVNGLHALRHFYASVLLDAGESIKALSEYLGHSDPGFTLRTYTHLMPSSEQRTRQAVDRVLAGEVTSHVRTG